MFFVFFSIIIYFNFLVSCNYNLKKTDLTIINIALLHWTSSDFDYKTNYLNLIIPTETSFKIFFTANGYSFLTDVLFFLGSQFTIFCHFRYQFAFGL